MAAPANKKKGMGKGKARATQQKTPPAKRTANSTKDEQPSLTSSLAIADTQIAHDDHLAMPHAPISDVDFPDLTEHERAVEAAKATIPASATREELRKDPIYRIMHALPRSDFLEVVRSRFAAPHCARAAAYFDLSYMKNPLRHLRLQIGCDGATGMHLFFPRIAAHRHTLRVLDLSRNQLSSADVVLLCNALGLGREGDVAAARIAHRVAGGDVDAAASASTSAAGCSLELLDLSYNTKLGNDGALHVLRAVQRCGSIRALLLRSVGVEDAGALAVSDVLRRWPAPVAATTVDGLTPVAAHQRTSTASATKFYLNLNENFIGSRGTYVLGKGLPHYVSLTLAKQRLERRNDRKRMREQEEGSQGPS